MEKEDTSASMPIDDLETLVQKMTDPNTGVSIKDRSWLLRTYKECFVGKDLVDWFLRNNLATTREEAVEFGNKLQEYFIFQHVTRDHKFKDESLYYRFDPEWKSKVEIPESWGRFIGNPGESGKAGVQPTLRPTTDDMHEALLDLEVTPHDKHNIRLLDNVHPSDWKNPNNPKYNMVVVGAGAAGLVTAAACSGLGAKVAIIERHLMGGDCLNYGCVPSKALLKAASAAGDARRAVKELGLKLANGEEPEFKVDFAAVMERMRRLRADISKADSARRFQHELGVDVYVGTGKFLSGNSVEVTSADGTKHVMKFSHATIATGARPAVPPIPGIDATPYYTNETIFNLTELPARVVVVGAGAVGCELAQSFARFGSQVTICTRSDSILSREDPEAVAILEESFKKDGITIIKNVEYVSARKSKKNDKAAVLTINVNENGAKVQTKLNADVLLLSTGRIPNVKNMGLEAAGVKFSEKDGVIVDDQLQTSNSAIFACGDVCSQYKFTHMADAMARIVVRNSLFLGRAKVSDLLIPWCTYTFPEVAHVGPFERDLEAQGVKTQTYKVEFKAVDRSILDDDADGFVKVWVTEGTDQVVAATIIHSNAGDLISELSVCIQNKIGLGTLATVIHPYPTQADAIRRLGDMYNRTRLTTFAKIFLRKLAQR